MSLSGNIKSGFYSGFLAFLLFTNSAYATTGISALGDLWDGLWFLGLCLFGISLSIALIIALFSSNRKAKGTPAHLVVLLIFFTCFALKWFFYPELDKETALVIVITLVFYFGVICLPPRSSAAHWNACSLLLVCSALLLSNPVILSFKKYTFIDEVPFTPDLMATEITHPIFGDERLKTRFLQTSDGALYYGTSFFGPNMRSGELKRERADSCVNVCPHCDGDCFSFFAIHRDQYVLARPRAIIDFQKRNNFPQGEKSHPFALINIPLKDEIVNPNSKTHKATVKLVSNSDNEMAWNPSTNWLWRGVCGGGVSDHEAEALVWAGADINYSAKPDGETIFNCAIRSRDIQRIRFFAKNGADPNLKSRANRTNYPHPNAMFLAMRRYLSLEKKTEIFNILVGIDVNINAQHKDGETLLHRLVADSYLNDRVELCKLLLSIGVGRHIVRDDGATPLILAKSRRDKLLDDPKRTKREEKDLAELNEIIMILESGLGVDATKKAGVLGAS